MEIASYFFLDNNTDDWYVVYDQDIQQKKKEIASRKLDIVTIVASWNEEISTLIVFMQ